MKITRQQRYEYRDLLIKKGVPEEIAVIASERADFEKTPTPQMSASELLDWGMNWSFTEEGFDIWHGVFQEAGGNW